MIGKKLKILIITHFFPPLNSIASHRAYSWAKYWSRMGYDITVLTTKKDMSDNRIDLPIENFKVIEIENTFYTGLKNLLGTTRQTLKYGFSSTGKTSNISLKYFLKKYVESISRKTGIFIARMPEFTDFWYLNVLKEFQFEPYDVVVSSFGPYIVHLLALRLKKRNLVKVWIADYRDLWTQNHIFKGLFPFTIIEGYLENKTNKTADVITTVSEPLAEQIKNRYKINNVEVIYNGFDKDVLKTLDPEPFWKDSKIRIVYTGTIYPGYQDPSPLFQVIKELDYSEYKPLLENLEVLFAGKYAGNLDELINKFKVNKYVKHLGFLKYKDSLRMQRDASILLFLEFKSRNQDGILTGKLMEYLFSGTQIWAIGVDEQVMSGKLIRESGCGVCFGTNKERLKSHLIEILKNKNKPKIQPNLEILKTFSRKIQAEKLLEIILEKYHNQI